MCLPYLFWVWWGGIVREGLLEGVSSCLEDTNVAFFSPSAW